MTKPWTRGLFDLRLKTLAIRLRTPVLAMVFTSSAAFGLCAWGGVRLNSTGSLPLGLYHVSTAADANLVEFCPPEPFFAAISCTEYRNQGNCPDGDNPLLKPIVARPGDVVVLSQSGLQVNGYCSEIRRLDPRIVKGGPFRTIRLGRIESVQGPFGLYRLITR